MVKCKKFETEFTEKVRGLVLDVISGEYRLEFEEKYLRDLHDINKYYFKEGGGFWIAVERNELVGTIALENNKGKYCIKRFYVRKNYRRRGIGKDLLNLLIQFAQDNSINEIFVSTVIEMDIAAKFYKKMGFERIKELPKEIVRDVDTEYFKYIVD